MQQEIKREEDSSVDEQQDNRKDTVRIHKATEEVSEICVNYLLLNIWCEIWDCHVSENVDDDLIGDYHHFGGKYCLHFQG